MIHLTNSTNYQRRNTIDGLVAQKSLIHFTQITLDMKQPQMGYYYTNVCCIFRQVQDGIKGHPSAHVQLGFEDQTLELLTIQNAKYKF
jgi:hypothetical protein